MIYNRHVLFQSITLTTVICMLAGCGPVIVPKSDSESGSDSGTADVKNGAVGCYGKPEFEEFKNKVNLDPNNDVLVLIDQTTKFDSYLAKGAEKKIGKKIQSGNRLGIGTFSEYTKDDYAKLIVEQEFEPDFPVELEIDAKRGALKAFKDCLSIAKTEGAANFKEILAREIRKGSESADHSNIAKSIKGFSVKFQDNGAKRSVLVVLSDMLENSSTTSFYGQGKMRKIDPVVEMEEIVSENLLANLKDVHVYVIGAGLVPESDKPISRATEELKELVEFWTAYFKQSGAATVTIGEPELFQEII